MLIGAMYQVIDNVRQIVGVGVGVGVGLNVCLFVEE
jgi:hypothetical protein